MRIGIFGGTFDPIHTGHLIIAEAIRTGMNLDEVMFVPVGSPPHKNGNNITDPHLRLEMVKLAIVNYPHFSVNDIEVKRKGRSFTIDTVNEFQELRQYRDDEFVLIIGGDNLLELEKWHKPDEILDAVETVVAVRPGFDLTRAKKKFVKKIQIFKTPLIDISSSKIRDMIHAGQSVKCWVPENVKKYIEEKGLYR